MYQYYVLNIFCIHLFRKLKCKMIIIVGSKERKNLSIFKEEQTRTVCHF
jgi:hypothetical protein